MRRAFWPALAGLAAVAGAQQTIALKYEPFPAHTFIGGEELKPLTVPLRVPKGFTVTGAYTGTFPGGTRRVAMGTYQGKPAAVVDLDGKGDLTHVKPCLEDKGDGRFVCYGPFMLSWTVEGRPRRRPYRLMVLNQPNATYRSLSPCGQMVGRGTVFGKAATFKALDMAGTAGMQSLLSVEWGGTTGYVTTVGGLGYGNEFESLALNRDQTAVKISAAHPKTTIVRVPADEAAGLVYGPEGEWLVAGKGGELRLPTGSTLTSLSVSQTVQNRKWLLSIAPYSGGGDGTMRVVDTPKTLSLVPLKVERQAVAKGATHTFSFALTTAEGWRVLGLSVDRRTPPAPVLELLAADGTVVDSQRFSYG